MAGIIYTINDSGVAVAAINGGRFCARVTNGYQQTGLGNRVYGVSLQDQLIVGNKVGIQLGGFAEVLSGAALTDGQLVMSDASGQAVPFVVTTGNYSAGYCDQAVAASGQTTIIRLTPDTTPRP